MVLFGSRKFFFAWVAVLACVVTARAQQPDADEEGQFRFRFVGPKIGNRIASVAGVPGDPNTYYAGAASGGVWKSTDRGNRWTPVFDKQPVAAIGSLAVAPSDPSVVWAGTSEAWVIRDSDVLGNGIYKSTDAGKTWTNMGLQETGRIGRIVVHPSNPDIVFACALGRVTGPQQERGVFRTIDGGQHWERVLFAGENVGCSGLSMDAHNSRTLFAGMWQVEMHTWGEFSGGPEFNMTSLERPDGKGQGAMTGHAMILNEYGWLWLNRDGSPTRLTEKLYPRLLGENATAQDRLAMNAYLLAGITEYWRAYRLYAGVLHFVYLTSSEPPQGYTSDSFADVKKLELNPYFRDYMSNAFAPLGVYLSFWQPTLTAGNTQSLTVMMVNDEPHSAEGTLTIALEATNGERVEQRTTRFSLAPLGQQPQVTGKFLLKAVAETESGGSTASRRRVSVVMAKRSPN